MKIFKPLKTIIPLMVRLGIHSYNLTEPKNEFFTSWAAYYIIFIANILMILSGSIFVYQNLSDFGTISEPLLGK